MKRSLQEYVELVVFGLVALLVGTGLLWLVGWVLSLGGIALKWVAGLLWNLLRFIVPVAIAGGLVYFLVKAAQDRQPKPAAAGAGAPATPAGNHPAETPGSGAAAEYSSGDYGAAPPVAEAPDAVSPADVAAEAVEPVETPPVDPDATTAEASDGATEDEGG